ncbi:gas vesicle protein GvpN [Oscillatoria sp. FACHB-1407]|uniref:gas vesicle protein GvpN n=1 Tax=Oscillatoria sp. FACHB-1407 TaxID=2692847 RepID=UPI0016823131|nr:gas vesicle protein GvpN [Oscillatoria sp. FACHB-1407]MBD2460073.1 gas vesicle protein GvpN [Oscillatoria sp. FACHB-1407]
MTTVLRASPRRFVNTPAVERVATRALRYLQSGFSVHLRGPAGTGKTTLALHLADLLSRPIMLLFGDDEFKTSDLIGNQSGYTRKKVVDNFIHSVVKVEDELRQNWVDSRLTLACREGFTLVYDEFNRSRPEVNNVLLSALEEKLLVLPPSNNRTEYIRVNPHFRAIFTSNPEEYCGVHDTQDALMDRLITINMPEPDELTQQEIAVQKTGIDRESALTIVRLVKGFRTRTNAEKTSGLRSCLMLAKVCHEHGIVALPENPEFRDICQDVLLSRAGLPLHESTQVLWQLFNDLICDHENQPQVAVTTDVPALETLVQPSAEPALDTVVDSEPAIQTPTEETLPPSTVDMEAIPPTFVEDVPHEQAVYIYLQASHNARPSEIEAALNISRYETVNALRSLTAKGLLTHKGTNGASAYRLSTSNEG